MKLLMRQHHLPTYWLRRVGVLLLAFSLASCGGSDDGGDGSNNSPLPPSPVTQVQVVDGFSVAKPNTRTQLDLSAFVRGRGAALTGFTSEQSECGAGGVTGLTAEVDISEATLCQYRFTARSGSSEGAATLSVLSTLAATPVLEPLSVAMTLSDSSKTFDVIAMYGGSLPVGYGLKADSVSVQGGTVQGIVTQSGNSITYMQPGVPDWNRVLFTLEDPARTGEDILGTLYVTVSESANQAPTISNIKYNYSATANGNTAIVTFQTVTLDLVNLGNLTINDPEGKQWQLIDVQSYSASVVSANPDDVTNKRFTFQAGTVGEHIVSYVVGDHDGGYRMGLMSIYVGPKELSKDWVNIDLVGEGKRFYAPPLYSEVKSKISNEYIIEPVWDIGANSNLGNTIGAVGNLAATAYCSGYRLPNEEDMAALYRAAGMLAIEREKYPKGRPYLISDGASNTFKVYSLITGLSSDYIPGVTANPYVVCVSDHGLSYTATANTPFTGMSNTVISDGQWHVIGRVDSPEGTTPDSPTMFGEAVNMGAGSLTAANFRLVPVGCSSGTCSLEARGASDEYGTATVQIANAVMTGKTATVPVTFLQNVKVKSVDNSVNNSRARSEKNKIIVTLEDINGSTIQSDTPVTLSYRVEPSVFGQWTVDAADITFDVASSNTLTNYLVNENSQIEISFSSSNVAGGDYQIIVSPEAHGLPSEDKSVLSTFISSFYRPDGIKRNLPDADMYCNSMAPAGSYRLPTAIELIAMFVKGTSATGTGEGNANLEMCTIHGWPFGSSCENDYAGRGYWTGEYDGDGYIVFMDDGSYITQHPANIRNVACIFK